MYREANHHHRAHVEVYQAALDYGTRHRTKLDRVSFFFFFYYLLVSIPLEKNKHEIQRIVLDKASWILQRQKEEAEHIEDTERLVTEIEMLKVVLYLVSRRQQQ
jgi:hypothetical protein